MENYIVRKVDQNLYSIQESILGNEFPVFIYLVVGSKKAALIDTGLGTGDLRKVVAEITDLPVVVLHTHGHGDHIGADALFDTAYLHRNELTSHGDGYIYETSAEDRLRLFELQTQNQPEKYAFIKKNMVRTLKQDYLDIKDKDVIDLGSIQLTAIETPGHTTGSVSYVSSQNGYAFTGDGIADIHWFDTSDQSVEGFLETLNHFERNARGIEKFYAAHVYQPFGLSLIHNLKNAAASILNGSKDTIENSDYQFLKHGDMYAHRSGAITIYYKKEHIYQAV